MSRIQGRFASSTLALVLAAGLVAPAFAADTTTTIAAGTTQTTAVTASPVAPDTYTLNILGTLRQGTAGNVTGISVQGSGSGSVFINNDGRLQGRFNFPTATGSVTLNNNSGADPMLSGWHTGGITTFGSGNDRIENGEDGVIAATTSTTFAFGAGTDDRFVNAGRLITERSEGAGTMTLTGLETFENSGLILLGSKFNAAGDNGDISDGTANDRLIAQGVAFTGSGDSRIALDASLADVTQTTCASAPVAADCVDFTGGSTAGSTLLTIRDASLNSDGATFNSGIALIIGSSAAEHFILSPDSDYYVNRTSQGPMLQKRLIGYQLVYDDAADTHKLVGILADEAFQAATFAASAQETWRATAGTWFQRQADLRATPGGLETSGGAWARLGAQVSERDVAMSLDQGGTTYDYDVSNKQRIASLSLGADFMGAATQDSAWVVGGMAGFVRSDVDFEEGLTETVTNGFAGGLYASYLAGPLFVDALVNVNLLHLQADMPNMNLGRNVTLEQDYRSLGGQVEAGWRFLAGEGLFVEPLVGASYVVTKLDDMAIPGGGGSFDFDDKSTSRRVGGGLRVGLAAPLLGLNAAYNLTGRYWSETDGEYAGGVTVVGGPALAQVTTAIPLVDDFGGGFTDIDASLNLYSDDGALSGFVNLGGKFAHDYHAVSGAVGVRLAW